MIVDNWNKPWDVQDQEVFEYLVDNHFSSRTIQRLMARPIGTIYRKRKELRDSRNI